MPDASTDIVIVGAGVAGLTLARELRQAGHAPVVLERSRGVGGRCATRRVDGQAADHGVAFLHGHSRQFLEELTRVDAPRIDGWPGRIDGAGTPCRPVAFETDERRVAFVEGVNRFPRHLAGGTDVRLGSTVTALSLSTGPSGVWQLRLSDDSTVQARVVALTMPVPSLRELLATTAALPPSVSALLSLVAMVPCLTVLARYTDEVPPSWEMAYPRESESVLTVSHDSSKRGAAGHLTLVIQARARWSRARVDTSPDAWSRSLLDEAARLYGTWVGAPASFQAHAWRQARVAPGCELTQPLLVPFGSGAALGCAGDGFHPAGGVEGAYLSGRQLASRIDHLLRRSH